MKEIAMSCKVRRMMAGMRRGLPIAACICYGAAAQADDNQPATVPERVIILGGNNQGASDEVMAVLYDTADLHFHDPSAPRFLLVDREGNTALGIGGYVEMTAMYDFDGAIANNGFVTGQIAVPGNSDLRNRTHFDAGHSRIFLQLVRNTRLGILSAYVESSFAKGDDGYGFNLKKAYIRLGNVQAGLSRSLFNDGGAAGPTIDYQGSCGASTGNNAGVSYTPSLGHGFSVGVSAEMPVADYTLSSTTTTIAQRVPDLPVYLQYSWDGGHSRVRASAIFRDLSYRDIVSDQNKLTAGWGIALSGTVSCTDYITLYYQGIYGRGIARYINDLSGSGYDLLPGDGSLIAPHSLSVSSSIQLNITKDLFVSGTYGFNRLYNQASLGASGYRRADYVAANVFYTCFDDLQLGVEYVHGSRHDMNREHGSANRVVAMVKYSF